MASSASAAGPGRESPVVTAERMECVGDLLPRAAAASLLGLGARDPHRVSLEAALPPFAGDLGQAVVRHLVLVFGIADHQLD